MNEKNQEFFNSLTKEEKNILVANHLKKLSRWDLKRILCVALDVDNYMDDDSLRSRLNAVINER